MRTHQSAWHRKPTVSPPIIYRRVRPRASRLPQTDQPNPNGRTQSQVALLLSSSSPRPEPQPQPRPRLPPAHLRFGESHRPPFVLLTNSVGRYIFNFRGKIVDPPCVAVARALDRAVRASQGSRSGRAGLRGRAFLRPFGVRFFKRRGRSSQFYGFAAGRGLDLSRLVNCRVVLVRNFATSR